MKKIRFATAILDFSERRGGAERYLVDLCARMANHGFEVHVYAEHWDEKHTGINFHRVKSVPFPKSLRLLLFAIRATREMEEAEYDITLGVGNTVKADVLQPHGGVHWAWFWRSLRAYQNPILWTLKFLGRVVSPKQWIAGWIEDAPYKRKNYHQLIAISEMVKQDVIRWYAVSGNQISVVYNGVDIERFHPRNRRYREEVRRGHGIGDETVILFVSNNFRMKGLRYLMQALSILAKEGNAPFKLVVLGRDRQNPYLRLARKLGILERVFFAGTTDEPEKYYGAADLLVHPTFYDACSLTVLEALSSGLPVITTLSNGAGGIMTSGREGFLVSDPRDDQALARQISFFLDQENRDQASIAARRLAEEYSLEANWRSMRDILQKDFKNRFLRGEFKNNGKRSLLE